MVEAINPVSFTGQAREGKEIHLTLGRLWVGHKPSREIVRDGQHEAYPPEQWHYNLTCVVWNTPEDITLAGVFDEREFITGKKTADAFRCTGRTQSGASAHFEVCRDQGLVLCTLWTAEAKVEIYLGPKHWERGLEHLFPQGELRCEPNS